MATRSEALEKSIEYFEGDDLAANVFLGKYALTTPDGNILEPTPAEMHTRLAGEFARIEAKYPNPLSSGEIFNLFDKFKYIVPQGSPMAGIGNPYQNMSISNCFVVESPYDSYAGLLKTDQEEAQIMKRRGGVGFDISTIRPKGLGTANAAKTTDGIGVFMERFSNTCREVAQGGRRGALMLSISVHHPEIETFVNIKRDKTKVTGANISVRLTDEFMKAVKDDTDYELRFPVDSDEPTIVQRVSARSIWDQIIDSAHDSAEPGLLFWDTVQRRTPAEAYPEFKSVSTNPCVTGDTWVMTADGPRQVLELLRSPFMAVVDGKKFSASAFWETGVKDVLQLITSDGHHLRLTLNHKLMTPNGWVEAGDLKIGDSVILNDHTGLEWDGDGTNDEGYLLGHLVGDGTFDNDGPLVAVWENDPGHTGPKDRLFNIVNNLPHRSDFKGWMRVGETPQIRIKTAAMREVSSRFGIYRGEKSNIEVVEHASSEFYKGYLRGLFDTDGHVEGSSTGPGISIRLSQSDLYLLRAVQRMLGRLGIRSAIRTMKPAGEKEMPGGTYAVQQSFRLIISGRDTQKFIDVIGFEDQVKLKKWNDLADKMKRGFYEKRPSSTIAEIIHEGPKRVYDCTVDEIHAFDANGILAHNCGEIVLSPYDSCRLLLVNTVNFVKNPFTAEAYFDFGHYAEVCWVAQRLMDDMVDLEIECIDKILAKIDADPEPADVKAIEKDLWLKIRNACVTGRRTGTGVTAVGDAVAAMSYVYGTDESIMLVEEIYKQLALNCYRSTVQLAKERGAFPAFNYDLEKDHEFINQVMDLDLQLAKDWKKYGRRNVALTTTAPAGSVSVLTQTTSGIEPAFLLSYTRRKKINPSDGDVTPDFVDDLGDKWLEFPVYHHWFKKWMEITGKEKEQESPYYGGTSNDIDWVQKVKLQAAAQKWICHAISNTTNLPSDVTVDTVKDIYMTGWELGCKGVTIYRDGSRSGVLVTNAEKSDKKLEIEIHHAPKRPAELPSEVHHMTVQGEKWVFFVGLLEGHPYEIMGGLSKNVSMPKRVKYGKIVKHNGPTTPKARYDFHYDFEEDLDDETILKDIATLFDNATYSAFTRTISLALRHGTDVRFVVEQIQKGAEKEDDLFSFSKAVSRVLKHYIEDGVVIADKKCLECGAQDLVYQEGCMMCKSCGSSKCG